MKILWATLVAVALVLIGLVGAFWGWAHGAPAEARTHERAVVIFNAMATYPGKTVYDQALEGAGQGEAEILVATENAAGSRRIVLAITAHHECRTNWECATRIWPDASHASHSATRCFEWSDRREWDTADEIDCPGTREIDRTVSATVDLPADAEARLEAALRSEDPVANVRSLDDLPGLEREVEGSNVYVAAGGITGYWTGRMITECVLGWKVDGEVGVVRLSGDAGQEPVSCDWEGARARAN